MAADMADEFQQRINEIATLFNRTLRERSSAAREAGAQTLAAEMWAQAVVTRSLHGLLEEALCVMYRDDAPMLMEVQDIVKMEAARLSVFVETQRAATRPKGGD